MARQSVFSGEKCSHTVCKLAVSRRHVGKVNSSDELYCSVACTCGNQPMTYTLVLTHITQQLCCMHHPFRLSHQQQQYNWTHQSDCHISTGSGTCSDLSHKPGPFLSIVLITSSIWHSQESGMWRVWFARLVPDKSA